MSSPEQHAPQWKAVFTTDNEPIAYFIAGKLQNVGITALVHKEPAGSAYGISVGLLGKVDVLVRSEDFEQAAAVLEEADEQDVDYPDEEDEEY